MILGTATVNVSAGSSSATTVQVVAVDQGSLEHPEMRKVMLRITFIVLTLAISAMISKAPAADSLLTLSGEEPTPVDLADKPLPQWRNGKLILLESSHGERIGISVFAGQSTSLVTFAVPRARHVTVRGFSQGADGTIALCGSLVDEDGRTGSYVGWVSPGGNDVHVVRTSPFVPTRVALASDGTIWTQGSEIRPRANGEPLRHTLAEATKSDAAVFRQFSRSGKLLRTLVAQSEIANPNSLNTGNSVFEAVSNRLVWYSGQSRQHIVIEADGTVTKTNELQLPQNELLSGGAVDVDGTLYVSSVGNSTWSIARLDLAQKGWKTLMTGSISNRSATTRRPTILGADGDRLIVNGSDSRHLRFFRISR
jgi:hypothetical protein